MSRSLRQFFEKKLAARENAGSRRSLKTVSSGLADFASNDYLGLAQSRELLQLIAKETAKLNGCLNGSTGSRLLTGNSAEAIETEEFLADFFCAESGLIINSGYAANLPVLSAVPQKDDTILYDELSHASIKDGARLSLAKRFSFRHNDVSDLEAKLRKASGRAFIVVESIYSMDGDECLLKEISGLARQFDATVVLDEAHSTGLFMNGSGLAVNYNLHNDIDIRIYTFGKAGGVHGAFVAGGKELKEFLVNFSRPFIYTTALSPHSVASIRCAMEFIRARPALFSDLQNNITTYNQMAGNLEGASRNMGAIQTVLIPGNENVRKAARLINDQGFDVRPIMSPTVPQGRERLRICLHAFNTTDQIRNLCTALQNVIAH
jgi:8-amino-7-oxononanoate synthase